MSEAAEIKELRARVERLESEQAVVRALRRYCQAIDYGLEDEMADCFTTGGRFVIEVGGAVVLTLEDRSEIREWVRGHSRAPELWHKHLSLEPIIDIDGDRATSTSYIVLLLDSGGRPTVKSFGRYVDSLVLEQDGRWRFTERIAEVESFDAESAGLVRG